MKRKECEEIVVGHSSPSFPGWARAAVAACLVLGSARAVRAGNLRLVERASVSGPQVTVGDIAYLEGFFDTEQQASLASLVLFEAPKPGGRKMAGLPEIREALYGLGVNLGEVLLCGSTRVEIRRPWEAGGVSEVEPPAENAGQDRIGPVTLETYLRAHIAKQFDDYGGRVEVQFSRTQAANQALSLTIPEFEFRIRDTGGGKLGLVSNTVEVLKENKKVHTIHILANVALVRDVVVAARPINRGLTIEAEDIRMSERRFVRLDQMGEIDARLIVGQQARRFIDRGEMICLRDVKSVPLVRRNELVTVWNRSGAVVIRTVGKALGSGSLGDEVEIKSERSGKRYLAKVTGVRTVEVGGGTMRRVVSR
jgi:flagella basal body P-ring formation protein FlgA